jgi:transposase
MPKEREILRLYNEGLSQRDICAALRCGHTTASRLITAAKDAGVTWEAACVMDDTDIRTLLLPRDSHTSGFAQPDFEHLSKELALPGVTRKLLWHEYCTNISDSGTAPYGYAQFCRLFDRHLKVNGATMHLKHEPGQRMFVDWAGDHAEVVDGITGSVSKAWLFVACLPYSAIIFARAYLDMKQASWLDGYMAAFEYFGGVSSIVVPDHCATATDRSSIYITLINERYYEFAAYYQTAIVPARVRRANDKALVEASVLICERNILAPLRHERFFSISDLNEAIAQRLEAINEAPFQKREGSRLSIFDAEEKGMLKALPPERYEIAEWKKAKVGADYHVCVETMRYSVSHRLIGETLDIRVSASEVKVFKNHEAVACHRRLYGKKGQYSTLREHMPKKHQEADIAWTPERFTRWAAEVGDATLCVIRQVLASRAIVEQAFVPCLNILGLAKRGRRALLESACAEIAARGAYPTYSLVKNTMAAIKTRGEMLPRPDATPKDDHLGDVGRIRGAGYYRIRKDDGDDQ